MQNETRYFQVTTGPKVEQFFTELTRRPDGTGYIVTRYGDGTEGSGELTASEHQSMLDTFEQHPDLVEELDF